MHSSTQVSRREMLAGACGLAAAASVPGRAFASGEWPSNGPIRMVVPFSPGASIDTMARMVAAGLSPRIKQTIIVENKAGAGGLIGSQYVANQAADGYTLLFQANPFILAPLVNASGNRAMYDPARSFQPIGQVAAGPLLMAVSNDLDAKSLREFIAAAQAKPDSISYGSAGIGTVNHLSVELLCSMSKIKLTHVPYAGLAPALTDLLGGRVQMIMASLPSLLPYVNAGRIRAIAVTSADRSTFVPNIPTVAEAGVPGYQVEAWWGLFAPAKVPASITQRLNAELGALLAAPATVQLLAREGANPRPGSADDFAKSLLADVPRWRKLVQDAHISVG